MVNRSDDHPATLKWNDGEKEALLAAPFAASGLSFYIPDEELAQYRERPGEVASTKWKALLDQEGWYAIVAMAYGPKDLIFAYLEQQLEKYPDKYIGVGLALARFGEEALPLVLAQAERVAMWPVYADFRLPELGPVDAAELALPIARLLSEKKLAVKKGAQGWLVRHPHAALAGLAKSLEDPAEEAPVAAALAVLAKAGHASAVRELLGTSAAAAKNKVFAKAVGTAGRGATKTPPAKEKTPTHRHVGWVYYRAHPASPLVLGDLDVMKDWEGSDGTGDFAEVKLPKGKVVTCDLDVQAPDVFLSARGDEVVLMAAGRSGRSLREEHEDEALLDEIARPLPKRSSSLPLTIRSGALVVSIAYNATPAEDASTKHLDEARFGDDSPRLPRSAPEAPAYAKELLVIPFPNGEYEVVLGGSKTMKCVVRKKS